jgi:MoaA/NifB/PqqE/SkfB family radical SAM enzyme
MNFDNLAKIKERRKKMWSGLFEEVRNKGGEMKKGKRKIVYALTDVCNWHCLHCYKRLKQCSDIARSIDQCKKDIKALLEGGYKIILGGAENLTNRDYLEIYGLVNQEYILSNGILPSQDKELFADLIATGIKCIRISWHIGMIEALESVPGKIVRRAIDNAIETGLKVMILCDIGNLNCNLLVQIAAEVKKAGATSIRFMQLMPTNQLVEPYVMTAEQKQVAIEQIRLVKSCYRKEDLDIQVHGTFNAIDLTENRAVKSAQGIFCPAGKGFIAVDTDDNVYPCPFLAQPEFQIGIWEDGQLKINKTIPNDGKNCLAETQLIPQHNFAGRRLK